jgi:hypothetical protein
MHDWLQTPNLPVRRAGIRWPFILVPFLVAGVLFWQNHLKIAAFVAVAGLIINIGNEVSPGFARGFRRFGVAASRFIGAILRCILLVPFFVFVMVPMATFQRIAGRDLLKTGLEPGLLSYWEKRPASPDYERQY